MAQLHLMAVPGMLAQQNETLYQRTATVGDIQNHKQLLISCDCIGNLPEELLYLGTIGARMLQQKSVIGFFIRRKYVTQKHPWI